MPDRYYEERHFVEDISLYFEQMGLPRTAGRVLGMLLISDPPEQSLNDLCEVLQTSKSWRTASPLCGSGCKRHMTCSHRLKSSCPFCCGTLSNSAICNSADCYAAALFRAV
jgi:hypothetical protein